MSEFRTFSGKTVDEAMEEACRQLGVPREKLEIEILSGGSSGIFGLVGKKKAQVRARIREEINLLQEMSGKSGQNGAGRPDRPSRAPRAAKPKAEAPVQAKTEPAPEAPCPVEIPVADEVTPAEATPVEETPVEAEVTVPAPEVRAETLSQDPVEPEVDEELVEPEDEAFPENEAAEDNASAPRREARPRSERPVAPEVPAEPMTPELEALVREVMEKMLDGILGQIPDFEISGTTERVAVLVRDEDNSGLLIGREGQTLSAIQYLVNRIVIRRYGNPVKVQLNTGEYRERQDDNLRKMAIFLADKAKSLGRPQSTKPLSSYHRRVVHLALQEDEAISTRSKGDGPLKRVLILPRSRGESHNNGQRS